MKGAIWVIAIVAVIFLASVVNPRTPRGEREPSLSSKRVDVMTACHSAVRDRLVSPGSMRDRTRVRPYQLESGAWRYVMDVDSQNAFGALLRTRWRCDVIGEDATVVQLP